MGKFYPNKLWFCAIFLTSLFGLLSPSLAVDTQPDLTKPDAAKTAKGQGNADFKGIDREEVLPDIEAKTYSISVQKRSKSLRVYLFQQEKNKAGNSEGLPLVGKILLLTKGNDFIMAFRVLKTYNERGQFAASKVRLYDKYTDLELNDSVDAAEKVADLLVPEYTLKDQELDRRDLLEIEAGMRPVPVPVYDPELDSGTSPPPSDDPRYLKRRNKRQIGDDEDQENEDVEVSEEELETVAPDEVKNWDTDRHWFSLQSSIIKTGKPDGSAAYFTGGGIRYGNTAGKMIFARTSHGQDSFVWEGSIFYYTINGYETDTSTDSYTVMPLEFTLRYNLMFNESFGMFGYGGVIKNFIVSSSNSTTTGEEALDTMTLAFGAGMLLRLGPKWYLRADVGLEMIGAGLVLRF